MPCGPAGGGRAGSPAPGYPAYPATPAGQVPEPGRLRHGIPGLSGMIRQVTVRPVTPSESRRTPGWMTRMRPAAVPGTGSLSDLGGGTVNSS
jgi:hypothetical protein